LILLPSKASSVVFTVPSSVSVANYDYGDKFECTCFCDTRLETSRPG
jgi:hypothetical protein